MTKTTTSASSPAPTFAFELGDLVLITGWSQQQPTPGRVTGRRTSENLLPNGTLQDSAEYQVEVAYRDGLSRVKLGAETLTAAPAGATWPPSLDEIMAHWEAIESPATV